MSISPRHQAALDFAAAGYPVFPCVRNGKEPACPNGYKDATTDIGQINAWWAVDDYNPAICPEFCGWCVVEVDSYKPGGREALDAAGELPPTYTVRSPRLGLHYYFHGSLPCTAQRLCANVDTRGVGGYVLIPPSIVDGKPYEVIDDRDPVDLPGWISEGIVHRSERLVSALGEAELDGPTAIDRARHRLASLVSRGDVAREGSGGNDRTYRLATEIQDLGISPSRCRELLEEIWNPHCEPPWDSDELQTLCENAGEYAQNEAGAQGVAPASETFGSTLDKLGLNDPEPAQRTRFHFKNRAEQSLAKDPAWVINEILPERSTVVVAGAEKAGKTFVMLDMLLAIASNSPSVFGKPLVSGPTFYASNEGGDHIGKARRMAWEQARGWDPAVDFPFYTGPAPNISDPGELQDWGDSLKHYAAGRHPELIVLDTFGKIMGASGLDENSARDANKFGTFMDSLRDAFDCSVMVGAHSGKAIGNVLKGSNGLAASIDSLIEVRKNKDSGLTEVWINWHRNSESRDFPWNLKARKISKALVFDAIERKQADQESPFHFRAVHAALVALHAVGSERYVSTIVLISELLPHAANDPRALEQAEKALRALAKTKLSGYCVGTGPHLKWYLDSQNENGSSE